MADRPINKEPKADKSGDLPSVLRTSFMFSQGLGNTLHISLLNWLVLNDYIPDSLPREVPQAVLDIRIPGEHVTVTDVEKKITIIDTWDKLLEAQEKAKKGELKEADVLDEIIIGILKRDFEYLDGGRPEHQERKIKNSSQHSYLSHFRKYVISKEKSEHTFSDELGKQIRRRVKTILDNPPVGNNSLQHTTEEKIYLKLEKVKEKWEEKNQEPFYPENFSWQD